MSTVSEVRQEQVNVIRVLAPGVKAHPNRCAIARVIKKWHPHLSYVSVGKKTIKATDKALGVRYTWVTPLSVRTAIQQHDKEGTADFPEFELRPSEAQVKPIYGETSPDKVARAKAHDKAYKAKVASGDHTPRRLTAKEKAKYQRARRNA